MILYVHCPSESFEGIYNVSDVSGWRWVQSLGLWRAWIEVVVVRGDL